jgi:hypothetical protein
LKEADAVDFKVNMQSFEWKYLMRAQNNFKRAGKPSVTAATYLPNIVLERRVISSWI